MKIIPNQTSGWRVCDQPIGKMAKLLAIPEGTVKFRLIIRLWLDPMLGTQDMTFWKAPLKSLCDESFFRAGIDATCASYARWSFPWRSHPR